MANEKRLIDANALVEAIITDYWEHFTQCHDTDQTALIDMVREDIGNSPTVDAVEVVRCKNCNYFGGHGMCYCHAADEKGTPIFVREDDFCSYGERRTDV